MRHLYLLILFALLSTEAMAKPSLAGLVGAINWATPHPDLLNNQTCAFRCRHTCDVCKVRPIVCPKGEKQCGIKDHGPDDLCGYPEPDCVAENCECKSF